MAIKCSICAYNNPDNSQTCVSCGNPLSQGGFATGSLFQPSGPPLSGNTASFVPQAPQMAQMAQTPQSSSTAQLSEPPVHQMGEPYNGPIVSAPSVHAFAGHGVMITHQSWLLNENAAVAGKMLKTSFDILYKRKIFGLNVEPTDLQEHNVQTEMRHYLVLRRGVATVFLYIAPAGYDLYISRATTVLTSIDSFRVFSLIALIVISFFCFITIVFIPAALVIGLFLAWNFYRSFRYWLRERDLWVYLRKGELNDFQLDDVVLLEQVTDETLRATLKLLKLDPDKIVGPSKGYEHDRHIRIV